MNSPRVHRRNVAAKLGLADCRDDDLDLMQSLQALLQSAEVDMTLFFRALADVDAKAPTLDHLAPRVLRMPRKCGRPTPAFTSWLIRYAAANEGRTPWIRWSGAHACTPRIHATCSATTLRRRRSIEPNREITRAFGICSTCSAARTTTSQALNTYAQRRPDWARHRAGCSMLSCSS